MRKAGLALIIRASWILLISGLIGSCAPGPSSSMLPANYRGPIAEAPILKSGDYWVYERGDGRRVRGTEALLGQLRFPLWVGKSWSFEGVAYFEDDPGKTLSTSTEVDCEVLSFKQITVTAGTFGAFQCQCQCTVVSAGIGISQDCGRWTWWYAPEAKNIIQRETESTADYLELVEYQTTTTAKSGEPGEVPLLSAAEHITLGNAYNRQKRYGPALTEYKKALKVNPNHHIAYNNLGNVYRRQGHYDDAMAAYQKSLEINPNYALAHANLGRAYRGEGRYEDSIAELEKAIKLNPNRAYFHNNLSLTLRRMGRVEEAIEACKKAIAVDPNYKWAYRNLGRLYKETGRLEDAISALKKALEIDPNYSSAHAQLAEVYGRQGKASEDKKHSKKVIEELKK